MRIPHVHDADIAILGSGASGTHGLLQIIARLTSQEAPFEGRIRIVVIERDRQFHSGIPYGHRSGRASLLISALSDFLPDAERSAFIAWLDDRRESMLARAEHGAEVDSHLASAMDLDWILRHEEDIRAGRWEDLYLPRRLYGQYLAEVVEGTVNGARDTVEVEFLHADVNEVLVEEDEAGRPLVRLREIDGAGSVRFEARALSALLAVGSPPVRRLAASGTRTGDDPIGAGLVADIHDPGIEPVLDCIRARMDTLPPEQRTILLVGGNADALEFLIASHPVRRDTGAHLSILSTRGRPHYWHHDHPDESAWTPEVTRLLEAKGSGRGLRASELHAAVRSDLSGAFALGNTNSTVRSLMSSVGAALAHMDDYELCSMAAEHGIAISDLLRRVGGDSLDFMERGVDDGTITFIPGRFREARAQGRLLSAVVDPTGPEEGFAVIVNATGFETITDTRSPLLRQLLGSGTVHASASRTGIALDGSFRAAPGLFVLGPLMAGHHHGRSALWHIESVARIISLAGQVASSVVSETLARRSESVPVRPEPVRPEPEPA